MDHQGAVETMAAERYMLGELGHAEREAFESHFFDCRACAAEVRDAAAFVDNLKAVMREQPSLAAPPVSRWESLKAALSFQLDWAPTMAAAALVLAFVAGYQRFVEIPALRDGFAPRATVTTIIDPATRAGSKTITVTAGDTYAIVPFSFDAPAGANAVRLEFFHGVNPGNNPVHSAVVELDSVAAGSAILLSVPLPVSAMGTGDFNAIARVRYGGDNSWASTSETFQFRIERR